MDLQDTGDEILNDQCIFIRTFRVQDRRSLFDFMKAAAGPHDLGAGPDGEPPSGAASRTDVENRERRPDDLVPVSRNLRRYNVAVIASSVSRRIRNEMPTKLFWSIF